MNGTLNMTNYILQKYLDKKTCLCIYNLQLYPIGSMYNIFTYIYHKNQPFM